MENTIYSHTEIAEILKVDKQTVVRQIKSGKLSAMKIGKFWRITAEALEDYKEDQKVKYKKRTA